MGVRERSRALLAAYIVWERDVCLPVGNHFWIHPRSIIDPVNKGWVLRGLARWTLTDAHTLRRPGYSWPQSHFICNVLRSGSNQATSLSDSRTQSRRTESWNRPEHAVQFPLVRSIGGYILGAERSFADHIRERYEDTS